MGELFSWIEAHPVLVSSAATLLTGCFAIAAGTLAFRGAKSQAQAANDHTTIMEELHREDRKHNNEASASAIFAEVRDVTHRNAILLKTVRESNMMPSSTEQILGRTIIFDYNPEIVCFFPPQTASDLVTFYSANDMSKNRCTTFAGKNLSQVEVRDISSNLDWIVNLGLEIAADLNETLKSVKDYNCEGYSKWKTMVTKFSENATRD